MCYNAIGPHDPSSMHPYIKFKCMLELNRLKAPPFYAQLLMEILCTMYHLSFLVKVIILQTKIQNLKIIIFIKKRKKKEKEKGQF